MREFKPLPITLFGNTAKNPALPFFPSKNYYVVLNLNPTGINAKTEEYYTSAEIRKAYLQMARRLHPDKNVGDETAKSKFQTISQAFEVLQDKEKKFYFDKELRENPEAFNSNSHDLVVQDDDAAEDFSKLWEAANFSSAQVLEVSLTSPFFGRAILENSSLLSFFLPSVEDQFALLFIVGDGEGEDSLSELLNLPPIKLIYQRLKDKVEGYEESFVAAAQKQCEEASHFFKVIPLLFDLSIRSLQTLSPTHFEAFKTLIIVKKGELPIASLLSFKEIYHEQIKDIETLYQQNLSDLKKKQLKAYSVIYSIFEKETARTETFHKALHCLNIEIFPLLKELSELYKPKHIEDIKYLKRFNLDWRVYNYVKNYLQAVEILLPPSKNFDFASLEEFYQEALYLGFLKVFEMSMTTEATLSFPNNQLVIFLLEKTSFDFYCNFVVNYQNHMINSSHRHIYDDYILSHGEGNSPYFPRLFNEHFNTAYKVLSRRFLKNIFYGVLDKPYLTEEMQQLLGKIAAIKNYNIDTIADNFKALKNEYDRFKPFFEPSLTQEAFSKALERTGFYPELFKIQRKNIFTFEHKVETEDHSRIIQAILLRDAAALQFKEDYQNWSNAFLRQLTTYFMNQYEEYSYLDLLDDYKKHNEHLIALAEEDKQFRQYLMITLENDAQLSDFYLSGGFLYLYLSDELYIEDKIARIKRTYHFKTKFNAFNEIKHSIRLIIQPSQKANIDASFSLILEKLKICFLDKVTFNYLKDFLGERPVLFRGLVTLIAENSEIPILGNLASNLTHFLCSEEDLFTLAHSSYSFLERYLKEYPNVSGNNLLTLLDCRKGEERERVRELFINLGLKDRYLQSANLQVVLSGIANPSEGGFRLMVVPKNNNAMESSAARLLRQWSGFLSPHNRVDPCQLYAFYTRLVKEKKANHLENTDIDALIKTYREENSLYSWFIAWLFERNEEFPQDTLCLFEDPSLKKELQVLINIKISEINSKLNINDIHPNLQTQIIEALQEYHRPDLALMEYEQGEALEEIKYLEFVLKQLSSDFSQKHWDAYEALVNRNEMTLLMEEEPLPNQFRSY